MVSPIVPATLAFDTNGTPYSPEYGDIYHSADSGPGQARHVFLGGNGLPARWAGQRVFTILETGFGLGINFLATWQAWRDDPARCARLHFVSVEKHPFTTDALKTLHARYPEFASLAAGLQAAWPPLLPGLHRLHFEDGRITLTLALGDVADLLPKLRLTADAVYLDGFAPDRNPDMWAPGTFKAITRLARAGATLATYTAARGVRDALAAAGFIDIEKRVGFGRKRDMLAARYAPRPGKKQEAPEPPSWPERSAIVVGAGLAGATVSERLATRGWTVDLIERGAAPAAEASGIPAGVFHPHVSRDDSLLSRLTRAGFLYGIHHWQALERGGHRFAWERCGVLQLAKDMREETRMAEVARVLAFPPDYLEHATRAEAEKRAGREVGAGGWWFPGSGWARPAGLVAAQIAAALAHDKLKLHTGVTVHALKRDGGRWLALSPENRIIATAPVVVMANSHDAARLSPVGVSLARVRGQLTLLPPGSLTALSAVLAGTGHLIPRADGSAVVGATYDPDDADAAPSETAHASNLKRLEQLLPGVSARLDAVSLGASVGFRCVSSDRLPLIGALPDESAAPGKSARDWPRLPGFYGAFGYGSRGLTWAALAGELIASAIEGEPSPIETDLASAIDPARFLLRQARRGGRP